MTSWLYLLLIAGIKDLKWTEAHLEALCPCEESTRVHFPDRHPTFAEIKVNSWCPGLFFFFSLVAESVFLDSLQRATVETLWPLSFSLQVWLKLNEPNWTSKQNSKLQVFSTFLTLKMLLSSKRSMLPCSPLCAELFSAQVACESCFRLAEAVSWLWITARAPLLQGLCIINTLSYIQWSPLQKDTRPKTVHPPGCSRFCWGCLPGI